MHISINIIPGHSEAIITNNYTNAQKFLDEVDAAAVYVNASTRFTDGFEFGYRGRDRYQYPETPCQRTDGTACTDNYQIYHLRKWANSSVNLIFFEKVCYTFFSFSF